MTKEQKRKRQELNRKIWLRYKEEYNNQIKYQRALSLLKRTYDSEHFRIRY